eukprot:TRINITY_DN2072_c0_g2_i2.p1 TRINITY_DN2072_c0_g2~~TRINITY_DN2072_c0_g2_i2.p1  ORF type:complete len:152 (+),score=63.59 TRINITY_DN2072_c0_g2_i2:39-458(+)
MQSFECEGIFFLHCRSVGPHGLGFNRETEGLTDKQYDSFSESENEREERKKKEEKQKKLEEEREKGILKPSKSKLRRFGESLDDSQEENEEEYDNVGMEERAESQSEESEESEDSEKTEKKKTEENVRSEEKIKRGENE